MFGRGKRPLAMAPIVPLPTGNVEIVTAAPPDAQVILPMQRSQGVGTAEDATGFEDVSIGWSIRHSDGEVVRSHIASRAEASRMLGSLAAHGAALPLVVHSPDGQSIGERLG